MLLTRYLGCAGLCYVLLWLTSFRDRQTNDKLGPFAGTFALGVDCATVQFDQSPHQCEADAQAAMRLLQRLINLAKHVEHVRELFARYADTVVANTDDNFFLLLLNVDV